VFAKETPMKVVMLTATDLRNVPEFVKDPLPPKELVVIDTADHLFDGKVSEVAGAIEDLLGDWNS